ncbi:MAG: NADH-quinone oxidoreductase subunit NuoG [Chloroflexi bacterium]|nr:NADH-quinone oxidoreductase subunit NuoG [Chloroflexota bacterium]
MTQEIKVTIDGREVTVPAGTLIVEAARAAGIEIPVFCYHPKMKPVGACRMCMVEIAGIPRLQTACTTPATNGMVVKTATDPVARAQRGVVELLLTNHPLDCPVCDKGGECPLQDNTFRFGPGDSRFIEVKRHYVKPVPLSDRILLDRERCIMCLRCVRFTREIAGDETLTLVNRASQTEVGVLPGRTFDSPFSGNTIEICPVGALTSRLYRFRARPWEVGNVATVCTQCPVGCNVNLTVRRNTVLRVLARENPAVDDGWLCDRGRFTYEFVASPERLTTPLIRRDGELRPASWNDALGLAARRLHGAARVGGIISPAATNEEIYLFQKLFRAILGSDNLDHRTTGHAPATPAAIDAATGSIAGLERARAIVVVDANPIAEQPVLDLRIKKAAGNGARILVVGPDRIDLARSGRWLPAKPALVHAVLLALARGVLARRGGETVSDAGLADLAGQLAGYDDAAVTAIGLSPADLASAADLLAAGSVAILYRRSAAETPDGRRRLAAIANLALATGAAGPDGAGLFPLASAANSQGALDLGALAGRLPGQRPLADADARLALGKRWGADLPAAAGLSGPDLIDLAGRGELSALYLLGVDPVGEGAPAERLRGAGFLVVQDVFLTPTAAIADVVLPGTAFAEKEGTITNLERRVQRLRPAVTPPGEARSEWRTLVDLAKAMGACWAYRSPADVFAEIVAAAPIYGGLDYEGLGFQGRQWEVPAELAVIEPGLVPPPGELLEGCLR